MSYHQHRSPTCCSYPSQQNVKPSSVVLLLAHKFIPFLSALFFIFLLPSYFLPQFASAAPSNCVSLTYTVLQTLVFDASESTYSVWLNACKYNAGLTITTLTPGVSPLLAARHNAVHIRLTNILATSIQFDKSLVLARGSSLVVESTTISSGGAFFVQCSMLDGQAIFNSLIVNAAAVYFRDGIYNNSLLIWNNIRAVSTAIAFQVSGITITNTTVNATSFFLQATTANTGYAFQWVNSPVRNNSQLLWWNNTMDGAYAFHTTTATDWGVGTSATFSKNTFSGRATRNALQLLLTTPKNFIFDQTNIIKLGHVIVTHYGPTSDIRFVVSKSAMGSLTYSYSSTLFTSHNDTILLQDTTFSTAVNIKLPTTTSSSVVVSGATITGGFANTYRSLNTGNITINRSTITSEVVLNSAFLSYRLNATVSDSTLGDCLTSNHSQIWYSTVALNRTTCVCIKSEGLLVKSTYALQGSTVRSAIHTPVANFANAWSDSTLSIAKSTVAGSSVSAGYRVVQLTGEIQGATRHIFTESIFASTATGNDPTTTRTAPAPKNCVICYPKLSYRPTYNVITSQASVTFRKNQLSAAYSLSYFLYIVIAEGGRLEFDASNRATGLPVGSGQFYACFLSAQQFIPLSNNHLATAVQQQGPSLIVLAQFININAIEIRRAVPLAAPVSTGTSYKETFSIQNSTCKTIYILVPESLSLTSEIVNVSATSKVSMVATSMTGAQLSYRLLTTPTLYQSIGAMYTSKMEIINGKGALLQHYVTSYSGTSLLIRGNTLTNYIRLRGGLYDSFLTLEANNVRAASAYALWVDYYAMRASTASIVRNVLVTTATGTATYALYWSKSPVTVGTELIFDANNIQGRNCFYVADADFRSDTSVRLTRNTFATTAKDFTLRFNVSGSQIFHDHTNRHANGRIYIFHYLHSKSNTFLVSGNASYKPASFQWTYYNTQYTSQNDVIRLSSVDFSEYITISFPTTTSSSANVSVVTAAAVSIFFNRPSSNVKANVEFSTATSVALYSVKECTNCIFGASDTKLTTFLQLSGLSYNSKHIAERCTMTTFKSSGLYNASTLRLFRVSVTGTASPIVTLDAAWFDALLDIDSSSFTTSTQKAIQISKHLDGSSGFYGGTVHQILNSNITVNSLTLSTLKTVTPRNCGLCYIRSSLLPLGASVLNTSQLIVKGTTFYARYRDTYHIFANTIGGRITYDQTNKASGDAANKGRIYIQQSTSSKGNTIVLNNHLNLYAIEVLRITGTLGSDERIGLFNSTPGGTATFNLGNTQSLTLGFDTVGFTTTNIFGGDLRGAYISLQRITGTRLSFAATNAYATTSNVSFCKLTAELYHSVIAKEASMITFRENLVSNPSSTAGMRIRGGLVDSRMLMERNIVTRLTSQPNPYALWVDSFTVKSSVLSILQNNFTVPGLIVGGSMGIYWLNSPIYTCSDVIVDGNNITGWHGFYMAQSDLLVGGTLWFRRNFIGARNQSYFGLRVNITSGRLDFDTSNTLRWGSVMVTHMTSSKDNVLAIDGLVAKSQIGSIDWQYQAPPGGATTYYTTRNDTIWLKDIQLVSYLSLALPNSQNLTTNISGVSASYMNIFSRSGSNWNVWVTNSKSTTSYLRIAATTECMNCSFVISDSTVLTYTLFQGRMINSSQLVRRSIMKEMRSSGEHRNSSVTILLSTMTGSTAVALLVDATWEDSSFLIDSCLVSTSFHRAATFMKHVNGTSVHRFFNTTVFTTATGLPSTVAARPTPPVCALCYVQAYNAYLRPSFNDKSSFIAQRNTFVSTSYVLSYLLYVIMNGGRIDYDNTNRAFGTASYSGRYYIAFNKTSHAKNAIVIANARFVNLIEVVKLAATSQVIATGDTIGVANSTTKAVWLSYCSMCNGLSLTLFNITAISSTVNLNFPQLTNSSRLWVRRVNTPTFYILCPSFNTASVFEMDSSIISTIQFYVTLRGTSSVAIIRNNTLSVQLAMSSNVGLLDGAQLHVVGNTITSVSTVPFWIQNMRIANHSLININSNVIRGSLAVLTAKANGIYWHNSPIMDGSVALLINNTITAYDYAVYFSLGEVASQGTLWVRANTFVSVLAAGYTLRVNVSGGRIDHDGSNTHRVGIVYILHSARSKDNIFVVSTKFAIAGAYWVYSNTALGVLSSTNDTVVLNDITTVAMTGPIVITLPETNRSIFNISRVKCVSIQFSCPKFVNASAVIGQVTATTYILLSISQALAADVGITASTVTTYISLANIVADNRALVYVRATTASYLLSTGTVRGRSSLLFQRLTLIGTAVPLLALDNVWAQDSLLEVDQCTLQAASHRIIAISKHVTTNATHRFTRNVIVPTVTALLAGSQPTPNVGGLAYLQPYGSTIPTYIYNRSTLSITNGNTFMCYVRDCYMLYITNNGGKLDIDNSNRYRGSAVNIGRLSVNEGGNSSDSLVVISYITNLYYFHYRRLAGAGTNSSLYVANNTGITYAEIRPLICYGCNFYVSNTSFTNTIVFAATTLSNHSQVYFKDVKAPTLTHDVSNFIASKLELFTCTMTTYTHRVVAYGGSTLHIKSNTVALMIEVRGGLSSAFNPSNLAPQPVSVSQLDAASISTLIIESNTVTSTTAHSALWFNSYAITNAVIRLASNSLTSSSPIGKGLFWIGSPALNSTIVMESNTMGSTWGMYFQTTDIGMGSILFLRKNSFIAKNATCYTVRLWPCVGSIIDHDGSNVHTTGIFELMVTKDAANNYIAVSASSTFARLRWIAQTTAITSNNNTVILMGKVTVIGGVDITTGVCNNSRFLFTNSTVSGSTTIAANTVMNTVIHFFDSTNAAAVVVSGTIRQNSTLLIQKARFAATVTLSATVTDNARVIIADQAYFAPASSHGLVISGQYLLNAQMFIRDANFNLIATGIGVYVSAATVNFTMVNTRIKTLSTAAANLCLQFVASAIAAGAGVEIWGNTFVTGGVTIPVPAETYYFYFFRNTGPTFTITNTLPAATSPTTNRTRRYSGCNVNAANTPINATVANGIRVVWPCSAATLVPRCLNGTLTPVNSVGVTSCDIIDLSDGNPLVTGIAKPLSIWTSSGPRQLSVMIALTPIILVNVPALMQFNSLLAMNSFRRFTFTDVFNNVVNRGERALVTVDRSPIDFTVVALSYPSVGLVVTTSGPLSRVPPPFVATPISFAFDIFSNMAQVGLMSAAVMAKAPRVLFLTDNAPSKRFVAQVVRSCLDPLPPPTTTTTIPPTTTTTTTTKATSTTTQTTTLRTTVVFTLPTVPTTTAPESAPDSEEIDFSQLFPSNSMSEPTTTSLDTNEVPVPTDEPEDSNSDIATVPPAFTPPTIPQEYFSSDSEDGESSSIDYSNLPTINDVTSYPSELPTENPTADASLVPPTGAESSDFYYSNSDSDSETFDPSDYSSGSGSTSNSDLPFSGSEDDDVPTMSSGPGEPSVGPPDEPPTEPSAPSETSQFSYGEMSNATLSSSTSSTSSSGEASYPTSWGANETTFSSSTGLSEANNSQTTDNDTETSELPSSPVESSTDTASTSLPTSEQTVPKSTSSSATSVSMTSEAETVSTATAASTIGTELSSTTPTTTATATTIAETTRLIQTSSAPIPTTITGTSIFTSTTLTGTSTITSTSLAPVTTTTILTSESVSSSTPQDTTPSSSTLEPKTTTAETTESTETQKSTSTMSPITVSPTPLDNETTTFLTSATNDASVSDTTTDFTMSPNESAPATSEYSSSTTVNPVSSQDTSSSSFIATTISTNDNNVTSVHTPTSTLVTLTPISSTTAPTPTTPEVSSWTPEIVPTSTHQATTFTTPIPLSISTTDVTTLSTTTAVPSTTTVVPASTTSSPLPTCATIAMHVDLSEEMHEVSVPVGNSSSQNNKNIHTVYSSGQVSVNALSIRRFGIPINFTILQETSDAVGFLSFATQNSTSVTTENLGKHNTTLHQKTISVQVQSADSDPSTDAIDPLGSFRHAFGKAGITIQCVVIRGENNSQVAMCHLPPKATYNPTTPERLKISVPYSAYTEPCEHRVPASNTTSRKFSVQEGSKFSTSLSAFEGYFLISPTKNDVNSAAADVVTTVVTTTSSLISLVLGAAAFDAYALAALLSSSCASTTENTMVESMMYLVAPFRGVSKGNTLQDPNGGGQVGMIFGNIGLIVVIAVIQTLVAKYFAASRRLSMLESVAAVYFPSISYVAADLLYAGITIGSFSLVRKGIDGAALSGIEVFATIVGTLAVVIIPISVVYTVVKVTNPRFHKYTQFLSRPWHRRMFFPQTFIRPEVQRRAFSRHLSPFANKSKAVRGVYAMPVMFILGIILYLLPESVNCTVRFYLAFVLFVLLAIYLVCTRPYRYGVQTVLLIVSLLLLSLIVLVMARQADGNSTELADSHLALVYLFLFSIVLRNIFSLVVFYLEHRYWQHFQEQSLRDWLEDDDDASKIMSRGREETGGDDLDGWNTLLLPPGKEPRIKGSSQSIVTVNHEGAALGDQEEADGIEMEQAAFSPIPILADDRTAMTESTSASSSDLEQEDDGSDSDFDNIFSSESDAHRSSQTVSNASRSKDSIIRYDSSSMSSDEDFL